MKKVYIIDDDRDIVESLSMVLKSNGYDVSAQFDDENVVENIKKNNPDVIILDVIFPENSSAGFEIAREIKNDSELINIPIIMLSAVNERGIYVGDFTNSDRDPSWLPVNLFLNKPVSPAELLQKIESVTAG